MRWGIHHLEPWRSTSVFVCLDFSYTYMYFLRPQFLSTQKGRDTSTIINDHRKAILFNLYLVISATKCHSCTPWPQKFGMTNNLFTCTIFIKFSFPFFFEYIKFQSIVSVFSYSIIMYEIKLYTTSHMKSSHSKFKVIVNVNRL